MTTSQDDVVPPSRPWKPYVGLATLGLLIFGLVTWVLGLGPFAYRQILYGRTEIYMLNMSEEEVLISLDVGAEIRLKPESKHRAPILGGTTHITTTNNAGEVIDEFDVFVDENPVLYSVKGERCLVLSDVSSFYVSDNKRVEILETFPKGSKIVKMPNSRNIWPRETLRDEVVGAEHGVSWVEIVACPLLEKEERRVLNAHLESLLKDRHRIQKDKELRKRMLLEGGDAIDRDMANKARKTAGRDAPVVPPDAGHPDAAAHPNSAAAPDPAGPADLGDHVDAGL